MSNALSPLEAEVAQRVAAVRRRIEAAATAAGRSPGEVQLVGVSKRQPTERIVAAVKAGVNVLGENYVQEAVAKRSALVETLASQGLAPPRWHMIGHIQRRKARLVVETFDAVESVDREELADELNRRAQQQDRRVPILMQVNVSGENQKSGAGTAAAESPAAHCLALPHVELTGLMAIPANATDPESNRPAFRELRTIRDRLRALPGGDSIRELSMGMSGDFEAAISEGATRVRVGTALFGPRDEQP